MKRLLMVTTAVLALTCTAQAASFRGLHTGISLAEAYEVFKSEVEPDNYPRKYTLVFDNMDKALLVLAVETGGVHVCAKLYFTGDARRHNWMIKMVLQDCFWHRNTKGHNFGMAEGNGANDIYELLTSEKAKNLKLDCAVRDFVLPTCKGAVDGDFIELKAMGTDEVLFVTAIPGKQQK